MKPGLRAAGVAAALLTVLFVLIGAWALQAYWLAIVLLGLGPAVWILPKWEVSSVAEDLSAARRSELVNEYRKTLLQTLGGASVALSILYGAKQFTLTRSGQIADRFTH